MIPTTAYGRVVWNGTLECPGLSLPQPDDPPTFKRDPRYLLQYDYTPEPAPDQGRTAGKLHGTGRES